MVQWIEARDACNCMPALPDAAQLPSPSNLVMLAFPDRNQTVAEKFAQVMTRHTTVDECPGCRQNFLRYSRLTFLNVNDVLILVVNRRHIVRGRQIKINDPAQAGGDLTFQVNGQQDAVTFRVRQFSIY